MQSSVAHKKPGLAETPRQLAPPDAARRQSWIWFAGGGGLLLFSYGADNIALAAWLSPLFRLRFVRQTKLRVWLPLLYLMLVAAVVFQLRGMVPIPGVGYYIFLAITGIVALLHYLTDRWLVHGGIRNYLSLPVYLPRSRAGGASLS